MAWPKFTAKDRVLLHLYLHRYSIQSLEVSPEITQEGIARGIDIERKNVPRAVTGLEKKHQLKSEKKYVPPHNIKHMAYFLTDSGRKDARKIMEEVRSMRLNVSGETKDISFLSERFPGIPLPAMLKYIDRENNVDMDGLEAKARSERFVKILDVPEEDGPFVGRCDEMAVLKEWLSSDKHVIVVTGLAGIGKTSLLKRFLAKVEDHSILWFDVKKWTSPFDLAVKSRTFLKKTDRWERFKEDPPDELQKRVFKTLFDYTENNPTVIVMDNLHNASPSVNEFALTLMGRDGPLKIVLIGRSIPGNVVNELIKQDRDVATILLKGLSEAESKEFLRISGNDEVDNEAIIRSGGHPLLLKYSSKDVYYRAGSMESFLGRTVLEHVPSRYNDILLRIALSRNPVPTTLVVDAEDPKEVVSTMVLAGLVTEKEDVLGMDDMIKDAVISSASRERIIRTHRWNARAFKGIPTVEALLEAVYHFFSSGDYDEAYNTALSHADHLCKSGFAHPLLSIIKDIDVQMLPREYRMDHIFLLGQLLEEVGSWDEAIYNYTKLLEQPDFRGRIHVLKRMAYVELKRGRYERTNEYITRAMRNTEPDRDEMAEFLYISATTHENLGAMEKAISAYERITELTKESGTSELRAKAFYGLGRINLKLTDVDTAIVMMKRAKDIYKDTGLVEEELKTLLGIAAAYYRNGDFEQAVNMQTEAYDIAYRLNNQRLQAYAQLNSVDPLLKLKRFDEAESASDSALLAFRMLGDRPMVFSTIVKAASICNEKGDWKGLKKNLSMASRYLNDIPVNQARCHYYLLSAILAEMENDIPRAMREIDRANRSAEECSTFVFDDYIREKKRILKEKMEGKT